MNYVIFTTTREVFMLKILSRFSVFIWFIAALISFYISVLGYLHTQEVSKLSDIFDGVFIYLLFCFFGAFSLVMTFQKISKLK